MTGWTASTRSSRPASRSRRRVDTADEPGASRARHTRRAPSPRRRHGRSATWVLFTLPGEVPTSPWCLAGSGDRPAHPCAGRPRPEPASSVRWRRAPAPPPDRGRAARAVVDRRAVPGQPARVHARLPDRVRSRPGARRCRLGRRRVLGRPGRRVPRRRHRRLRVLRRARHARPPRPPRPVGAGARGVRRVGGDARARRRHGRAPVQRHGARRRPRPRAGADVAGLHRRADGRAPRRRGERGRAGGGAGADRAAAGPGGSGRSPCPTAASTTAPGSTCRGGTSTPCGRPATRRATSASTCPSTACCCRATTCCRRSPRTSRSPGATAAATRSATSSTRCRRWPASTPTRSCPPTATASATSASASRRSPATTTTTSRDIEAILADGPASLWQIAARLTWNRPWDQFPLGLRRSAVNETAAHLRYLTRRDRAVRFKGVRPFTFGLPGALPPPESHVGALRRGRTRGSPDRGARRCWCPAR